MPMIPFGRADVRKKILHVGFMFEQFAIKMPRIPIDQYTANIERRYRSGSCHVVILAMRQSASG